MWGGRSHWGLLCNIHNFHPPFILQLEVFLYFSSLVHKVFSLHPHLWLSRGCCLRRYWFDEGRLDPRHFVAYPVLSNTLNIQLPLSLTMRPLLLDSLVSQTSKPSFCPIICITENNFVPPNMRQWTGNKHSVQILIPLQTLHGTGQIISRSLWLAKTAYFPDVFVCVWTSYRPQNFKMLQGKLFGS